MDALQRLKLLSSDMALEPAEDHGCPRLDVRSSHPDRLVLSQAILPNGKRIALLKSLLTSACERNCYYCPFRAGREVPRGCAGRSAARGPGVFPLDRTARFDQNRAEGRGRWHAVGEVACHA